MGQLPAVSTSTHCGFPPFSTTVYGIPFDSFPEQYSKIPIKTHFPRFPKGPYGGSNPPLSASFYWDFQRSVDSSTKFPHAFPRGSNSPRSSRTAQRREPGTEPERTGLESDEKSSGFGFRGLHWPKRLFPKRLVTSLSPVPR